MPREDSHRSDHSRERLRLRLPSPSTSTSTRYSERSDHRSSRDGKISYREKGDGEGRRPRDGRSEDTKGDRRERESSQKDTRHGRPQRRRSRSRSRNRSKSPLSGKSQPPAKTQPNLDQFKTSGLLNAMNPVGGGSSSTEKLKPGEKLKPEERLKPNFGLSGKLAEDTNKFNGVVVKYNEPSEAKKPSRKWRLYPFKGEESLEHVEINKQSAFLLGRDRRVADIPIDHPSCSSQHAVIQFRSIPFERDDGTTGKKVRPYLVDLESSNGTFLNNKQIEPRKYHELFEKDCIKFGFSSREYVLMHAEYREDDN